MLGDAAGLARRDFGAPNIVEQRCLAVIDMAHNGDNRRARQNFERGIRLALQIVLDDISLRSTGVWPISSTTSMAVSCSMV